MTFERSCTRVFPLVALLISSCSSEPAQRDPGPPAPAGPRMLAAPDRWQMAEPARDPLASEAPVDAVCDPYAVVFEDPHLEIDTRACSYAVVEQPALTAAARGERLTGVIWHLGLVAELPATAHIALAVGGSVIWEQWSDIPSPPTVWELDVPFQSNVEQGAAIVVHLHNHGANQWRVGELRVEE